MVIAPHLPPPTCSIAHHERWQRAKVLIIAVLFGLLAGVTGAAIFVGYVWSGFAAGDSGVITAHTTFSSDALLTQVESTLADKIYVVYQKGSMVNGVTALSPADRLGNGVVALSSGWLIASFPAPAEQYKNWQILGPDGTLYSAERAVFDSRSGFVYIKIMPAEAPAGLTAEQQYKVAVFSTTPAPLSTIFVYHKDQWLTASVLGPADSHTGPAHLDTAPFGATAVSGSFSAGDLVIDDQGNIFGFMSSDNTVVPATSVPLALAGIDSKTTISYPSLGVEGWYSSEQSIIIQGQSVTGFLVDKVLDNSAFFKKGDVLLQINGQPFTFDNLWYTIGNSNLAVTVWRAGKQITVTVAPVTL